MITYLESSLFQSPAQTIVNTVNTFGIMGRGIAREFKDIYPEMFEAYSERCKNGDLEPGKLQLYRTGNKWILNFPTKKNVRFNSTLKFVESGLSTFVRTFQDAGIKSVSFPQLGCGTGGLNWDRDVAVKMESHLSGIDLEIFIHVYSDRSSETNPMERVIKTLRGKAEMVSEERFAADLEAVATRKNVSPLSPELVASVYQELMANGVVLRTNESLRESAELQKVFRCAIEMPYVLGTRACTPYHARENRTKYVAIAEDRWIPAIQFDGSVLRGSLSNCQGCSTEEVLWRPNPIKSSFLNL